MPELPEVEAATRNVRRWARGATIDRVVVPATRVVRGGTPGKIRRALEGRRIVDVDRRGKWMRLRLDDGARAFSHFGMSGKWVRRSIDEGPERWERLRIDVAKGVRATSLRYVDPRMFGRFVLVDGEHEDLDAWRALGPDPIVDGIDRDRLFAELARRRVSVKEAIMDQAVLAGVGNIQATEALFVARVDPRRKASSVSREESAAIARAIDRTLRKTIAAALGPEIIYVEEAGAPNPFRIYGRSGEPCPRCKTTLSRAILGGRGTAWCERCQS